MRIPLWPSKNCQSETDPTIRLRLHRGLARGQNKKLKNSAYQKNRLFFSNFAMSCVTDIHSDGWRRSRISTKMHCDFHQNLVFEASSVSARLWDAPAGSRITAGATLDLWGRRDHRYWPPTLDSSDFHSIFEREQCKSLTAVVTKSTVLHEKKLTPNIPQTKNFAKCFE